MKNLLLVLGTLALSGNAFANLATDSIHGAVTCTSQGGTFSVQISANRKEMLIQTADGETRAYKVTQTMGDTDTWYAPASGYPSLNFGDEGDFISFNSTQNGVLLTCPQGQEQDQ